MIGNLWLILSLAAAVLWGLNCALSEQLLNHHKLPVSFLLMIESCLALPSFALVSILNGSFKTGMAMFATNKQTLPLTFGVCVAFVLATFLIMLSVSAKNATLATLIEVSYPLFIVIFSWVLFREFHLNAVTLAGGLLILGGVALITVKG